MDPIQLMKSEFELRVYTESYYRIRKCLSLLREEQIEFRPNENLNSIANLILHLTGNVQQWIGTGIGKLEDHRQRDLEFAARPPFDIPYILNALDQTVTQAVQIVNHFPADRWLEKTTIQGFDVNAIEIVFHVAEHFSYHTGQISLLTKLLVNKDLGFYAGMDLA